MEQYIAAALVLILIVSFVPQNAVQQRNHVEIMRCEAIIEVAKEEAAQEGMFTDEIIDRMRTSFEEAGIDPSEVVFDTLTTSVKYRKAEYDKSKRELIEYKIGVPIKKVIAANKLFGISDEDNSKIHWFKGEFASERISH